MAMQSRTARTWASIICGTLGAFAAYFCMYAFRKPFAVDAPAIFTLSEVPIAFISLAAIGALILINDNQYAFWTSLATVLLGAALIGCATLGYRSGTLHPAAWLTAVGLGMYVPYIAFHVMVFERLIALFRRECNIGYLMYTADAFGYLGSCVVMFYRNFGARDLSWRDFFVWASYAMAVGCALLTIAAVLYFHRRLSRATTVPAKSPHFAARWDRV